MNELAKYKDEIKHYLFQRVYVYAIINKKYGSYDTDLLINDYKFSKYVKVRKFFIVRFDYGISTKEEIIKFLLTPSGELELDKRYKNFRDYFGIKPKKYCKIICKFKDIQPLTERDFRVVLNTITPRMLRFYNKKWS